MRGSDPLRDPKDGRVVTDTTQGSSLLFKQSQKELRPVEAWHLNIFLCNSE